MVKNRLRFSSFQNPSDSYLKASSQAVEQVEDVGDVTEMAILNGQQDAVDQLNDNGDQHKDEHQCVLLVYNGCEMCVIWLAFSGKGKHLGSSYHLT